MFSLIPPQGKKTPIQKLPKNKSISISPTCLDDIKMVRADDVEVGENHQYHRRQRQAQDASAIKATAWLVVAFLATIIACLVPVTAGQYAKDNLTEPYEIPSPNNPTTGSAIPFDRIVIFSDSFSDQGNVYTASNQTSPKSPPYWEGRFSNGMMFPDFLQLQLGSNVSFQNVAWGGATTNETLVASYSTFLDGPVPAVDDQINIFLLQQAKSPASTNITTLYLLYSGYNDYWWWVNRDLEDNTNITSDELETMADKVSSAVVENVQTLYQSSMGQSRLFLVADLPPMKYFPESRGASEEKIEAYNFLTTRHNELLYQKLKEFDGKTDCAVEIIRIHELYKSLIQHPTIEGFEDAVSMNGMVETACLSNNTACALPFGSIFWDEFHPTTHVHFLISQAMLELFRDSKARYNR